MPHIDVMDEGPEDKTFREKFLENLPTKRSWQDAEIDRLTRKLSEANHEIGRLTGELREANRQIVIIHDEDSFSIRLGDIMVHEQSLAAHVKAMLRMSHFQRRALIRELLEDAMELDPDKTEDWEAVDLTWLLEQ